jgi:hypothetical protein
MGIFDIFTGDSAKKAAEENKRLLEQNQQQGTATLQQGQTSAIGALDKSAGLYGGLASKYGKATDLALDALGVNGAGGNARATSAFQAGPGYQYAVDQSLQNALRTANAAGAGSAANSGNTLAALSDRAGQMANQEYGSWLDRLNGYVSPELSATSGQAGAIASEAPVYTSTASNIANLGTNTTNGITNQNTQAANAEMQGSGNLWGLGLNLAKLGVGALSGGTSLLGGGGGGTAGVMQVGGQYFPKFS